MANGRCECRAFSHGHDNARCDKPLDLQDRNGKGPGAWSAHHIDAKKGDILSNCKILCRECKEKTDSTMIRPDEKTAALSK